MCLFKQEAVAFIAHPTLVRLVKEHH